MASEIYDINLADSGLQKIEWVRRNCPLLSMLYDEFSETKPFAGKKVTLSIHLEAKTAYLCLVLAAGGAEMYVTGSNPLSTQDDVAAALESEGVPYVLFDEIEENPSVETVLRGRDKARAEGADFFIGIGGGSPMDSAKAISVMTWHGEEDGAYLYEAGADSTAYPVAEVPTTCGTGSEANGYAVLTVHEQRTKKSIARHVFPHLALADPTYLASLPDGVLRSTAVDALCHLMESILNTNATPYSLMCAETGLRRWSTCKDALLAGNVRDLDQAADLLGASTMAGMAIGHTGTSLPHGLSYALTYERGIPHGKACGRFLPGYLAQVKPEERLHVLDLAGFLDLDDLKEFLSKTSGWFALSDELREMTVLQLSHNPSKLKQAPFAVDPSVLYAIIDF